MMAENSMQTGMVRRDFLIHSCSAALCLATSSILTRRAWGVANDEYYAVNRDRFVTSFESTLNSAQTYMTVKYNPDVARTVCREAKAGFEKLLPELPYIGGDNHPGTKWILLAGHWLAFFRPMKAKGCSTQDSARMMYDLYVEYLDTLSPDEMKKRGEMRFSESYLQALKKRADNKTRFNENDWLSNFIPGDGNDFDYGYDYVYCPCSAYFKTHDAGQLAPFFCLLDFPEHKRMETGLIRMKTLAQGDDVCDFRFKRGRQVMQDWSTEVPRLKSVI